MFGTLLSLAHLHCCPLIEGWLLCLEKFTNVRSSIQGSGKVNSFGFVDPECGSSVSNVRNLAAGCHVKDLRVAVVVVAGWLDFKGDPPLLSKDWKGGQKGSLLQ